MNHSPTRLLPENMEDRLRNLCRVYRGETDNPYEINYETGEDREILFLKYHLWDVERSLVENPAYWKNLSARTDPEHIYDFALRRKLDRLMDFGLDRHVLAYLAKGHIFVTEEFD